MTFVADVAPLRSSLVGAERQLAMAARRAPPTGVPCGPSADLDAGHLQCQGGLRNLARRAPPRRLGRGRPRDELNERGRSDRGVALLQYVIAGLVTGGIYAIAAASLVVTY